MGFFDKIKLFKDFKALKRLLWLCFAAISLNIASFAWQSYLFIGNTFPGFSLESSLTVSPTTPQDWTGYPAGFYEYEKIQAVDGKRFQNIYAFDDYIRSLPAGRDVRYSVLRQQKQLEINVKTQTFNLHNLQDFNWIYLIFSLAHLGIAAILLSKMTPANWPMAKYLIIYCFAAALHGCWGFDYDIAHDSGLSHLFSSLNSAITPVVMVFFALAICADLIPPKLRNLLKGFGIASALIFSLGYLVTVPVMLTDVYSPLADLYVQLWNLNFVQFIWTFLSMIILLVYGYFKSSPATLPHRQIRIVATGSLLGFSPLLVFYLLYFSGLPLPFSLQACFLGFLCFPLALMYSIIQYQSFDIEIYIRKALIYYSLTCLLLLFWLGGAFILEQLLALKASQFSFLILLLASLPTFALYERTQKLIDRLFYREHLDAQALSYQFQIRSLASIEPSSLVALFEQTLEQLLHPSHYKLELVSHSAAQANALQPDFKALVEYPLRAGSSAAPLGRLLLGARKSELAYGPQEEHWLKQILEILAQRLQTAAMAQEVIRLRLEQNSLQSRHAFLQQLTSNLGHDLKSPLAASYAEIANLREAYSASDSSLLQQGLKRLHKILNKLSSYIVMSLDRELISQGRLNLQKTSLDLKQICHECLFLHAELIRRQGLSLEANLPELKLQVSGDAMRLEHVLSNLLTNAQRHAKTQILVELSQQNQQAVLRVSNDGPEIAAEVQKKIFERFYYEQRDNKRQLGRGLGLWICRHYLEAMGGTIQLLTPSDGGSSFEIRLPLESEA